MPKPTKPGYYWKWSSKLGQLTIAEAKECGTTLASFRYLGSCIWQPFDYSIDEDWGPEIASPQVLWPIVEWAAMHECLNTPLLRKNCKITGGCIPCRARKVVKEAKE